MIKLFINLRDVIVIKFILFYIIYLYILRNLQLFAILRHISNELGKRKKR